jgi:hypothetical protein
VMLREPISRHLSLYSHKVHEYLQTKDRTRWYSDVSKEDGSVMLFDEYTDIVIHDIDPDPWGIDNMGLYAQHLSKWLKFVDRKHLLAIAYDELKQDPKNVQRRIREFLGFDFPGSTAIKNANRNEDKEYHPSCYAQKKINSIFEPMNQDLYRLLNESSGPPSEQTPFPSFIQLECADETDVHSSMQVQNKEPTSIVLPNILLIGAQKAGTTAIGSWLFENGVCRPEVFKGEFYVYDHEVQFFDQKDRYEQGLEFYAKRYQHCNSSTFAMDATPNTLSFPENVESVYRAAGGDHLKNVKVIVLLREPVSRELSLYSHKVHDYLQTKDQTQWYSDVSKEDGSVMPFNEYFDVVKKYIDYPTPWGLGDTGHYARHLSKWLKFVDRKHLLAIAYDELKQDPKNVQRRIREFLAFDVPSSIAIENTDLKEENVDHPSCDAQTKLNAIFEPMNQDLYRLLNESPGPPSEQTPFPSFVWLECAEADNSNH